MSLPLQIVVAEPSVALSGLGQARFVWDDQPEPARRAARQAHALLEATGARGEGGFARVIVGDVSVDDEPRPIVTLRVTLGEVVAGAMCVPQAIGPRVLDREARILGIQTIVGLIADLATIEHAREPLLQLAAALRDGAYALGAVARFSAATLADALAARMAAQVATRVSEARHVAATVVAPEWPAAITIDPSVVEALGSRVAADGPELARTCASAALDAADAHAERLRRVVDHAVTTGGFGAIAPLRSMLEGVRREVEARMTTSTIGALIPPSRAPLDTAERAFAELAHPVRAWPLEAAGALGGSALASVAIGPFITFDALPGGGWTLAGAVTCGLWAGAAIVTRIVQALSRRAARNALEDAEAAYADAWRAAARRWFEPIALAGTRRALSRLAQRVDVELAHLKALAGDVDALVRAPIVREPLPDDHATLATAIDLGSAKDVLAQPAEPLFRRVEAELRGDWRDARPILGDPGGLVRAARATYAELAGQLPLASRTDVAEALRGSTRMTLASLRGELARWLPDGVPARRYVALPAALRDAVPEGARFDERLESAADAWLLALWRPL